MIRGGVLGVLVSLSIFVSIGLPANAELAKSNRSRIMTGPGPIIWPWGRETRFPWEGVQGLWQVQFSDYGTSQYIFKVLNTTSFDRILEITQYDPIACRVTAFGKGFESDRVIKAVMNSNDGAFQMTIHAFRTQDVTSIRRSGVTDGGPLVVLRIFPFEGHSDQTAFQLNMVQKTPLMKCD